MTSKSPPRAENWHRRLKIATDRPALPLHANQDPCIIAWPKRCSSVGAMRRDDVLLGYKIDVVNVLSPELSSMWNPHVAFGALWTEEIGLIPILESTKRFRSLTSSGLVESLELPCWWSIRPPFAFPLPNSRCTCRCCTGGVNAGLVIAQPGNAHSDSAERSLKSNTVSESSTGRPCKCAIFRDLPCTPSLRKLLNTGVRQHTQRSPTPNKTKQNMTSG